eukprot:8302884-Pyramimonas_sp.AAC.2
MGDLGVRLCLLVFPPGLGRRIPPERSPAFPPSRGRKSPTAGPRPAVRTNRRRGGSIIYPA